MTAARMQNWAGLSQAQQIQAVRAMAEAGWSEYAIAQATQLSVEFLRTLGGPNQQRLPISEQSPNPPPHCFEKANAIIELRLLPYGDEL